MLSQSDNSIWEMSIFHKYISFEAGKILTNNSAAQWLKLEIGLKTRVKVSRGRIKRWGQANL